MAESPVKLSNPDKLLWAGISKADLRDYYEAAADRLMPFVANRPLTIIRAPDGYKGEVFYQRHAMKGMSKLIGTVKVKGEPKPYLMIAAPRRCRHWRRSRRWRSIPGPRRQARSSSPIT